jgi:hypothetical protein
MPHHAGARRSAVPRNAIAFALLAAVGCTSDDGDVVVIAHSESGRSVIASPVDPRRVHAGVVRRLRAAGPVGDSIARYYVLADSADSLDAAFQEQRAALNRDARAMAAADRRSASYAREFDGLMKRVAMATRTREARDRLRRRATVLRTRLGSRMSTITRTPEGAERLRIALDSAAREHGTEVRRAPLSSRAPSGQGASLQLEPGVWWIAVEDERGELRAVRRHEVRAGVRDTVHIGS